MNVRRPTIIEMPNLKRLKNEEIDGGGNDDEFCFPANPKKQKTDLFDGFYTVPVTELDVHGSNFTNSWSTGAPVHAGDVELVSEIKRGLNKGIEGHKPPLLKSSRGRSQVLPSKFAHSVLHSWKKDKLGVEYDCNSSFNNNVVYSKKRLKRGGLYSDTKSYRKSHLGSDFGFHLYNSIELVPNSIKPGVAGLEYTECKDFDGSGSGKLYSSSWSSVTSVNQGCSSPLVKRSCNFNAKGVNGFTGGDEQENCKMNGFGGIGKQLKEKDERKEDFFKPGDFVLGDIVWAKCGKKFPAWPAVVIDPLWQAPEAVLRACVPGTLCVMYSRNGTQRDHVLLFLHGFLESGEDWIPVMKALSRSVRCIAIDLPGHGRSKLNYHTSNGSTKQPRLSVEAIAGMLCKVFPKITSEKVILVGYSMGARIALHVALKSADKVEGAVIISGSPGLENPGARMARQVKDDFRASSLVSYGIEHFLNSWYTQEMWNSLRSHPHFSKIVTNRLQHDDLHTLAKVLSDSSIGRQRFQGQTKLYGSKPEDFHMAIEEAVLAESAYVHTNSGNEPETWTKTDC